ncbi:MAG: DUF1501 domain-containing protein, partial [Dehalococcoidia bacterium]|nr:DUF1501 domain-containing protein [Dehalococcoidia bacterium]
RGGIDGLNLVVPHGDGNYYSNRPDIRIQQPGRTRGALNLDGLFGLHPAATGLFELWKAKQLGIVIATGLTDPTRSHFDAMAMMERGTPGNKTSPTGWIARHLVSMGMDTQEFAGLVVDTQVPMSLMGVSGVATVPDLGGFDLWGWGTDAEFHRVALRALYSGASWFHLVGQRAFDLLDNLSGANLGDYTPENGARYPDDGFGRALQVVAQLIKRQLGVRTATIDLGGWDTHERQGDDGQGWFASNVATLSNGLYAFMVDLGARANKVTVVVLSEFGRRVRQNESGGTDHGHGNCLLVIGGGVIGGIYGVWPGLATPQLDEGADLAITTDYRQVLMEILMRRLNNPKLSAVFPNAPAYSPLNMLKGQDRSAPSTFGPVAHVPVASRAQGFAGQFGQAGTRARAPQQVTATPPRRRPSSTSPDQPSR